VILLEPWASIWWRCTRWSRSLACDLAGAVGFDLVALHALVAIVGMCN
jgi:hypothetical protein